MQIIKHPGFADEKIMQKSLELLLTDRNNEFKELANIIGIPKTASRWECIILKFCLDYRDCFVAWSEADKDLDHNMVHKSMTLIRQLAKGRKNMTELAHWENLAYTLAEEYSEVYKRLS
jgi:5,10-methenyltetrahydromethanopterin hydrogenase